MNHSLQVGVIYRSTELLVKSLGPMNKKEIIENLNAFKERLIDEILKAYRDRGQDYGSERFNKWRRQFTQFLDDYLPGETSVLSEKPTDSFYVAKRGETVAERFWRVNGEKMQAYIDSLILDIQSDKYFFREKADIIQKPVVPQSDKPKNKVFIVHGHDGHAKEKTARLIEKLGFEAIILHEQASRGMTIIEKIEEYSNEVGFGIVLYTPDDMGNVKSEAEEDKLNFRARQNVVFEHGFLIGKLGRENVATLVDDDIELPNDLSGIVYINDKNWKQDIAKEMEAAGYEIDFNKLLKKS